MVADFFRGRTGRRSQVNMFALIAVNVILGRLDYGNIESLNAEIRQGLSNVLIVTMDAGENII